MDRRNETALMRLLLGELSDGAARRLRERLKRDRSLQAAYERLAQKWENLDLPEPAPAPPGFAARVTAHARKRDEEAWVPAWWSRTLAGRVATVALLASGVALGALVAASSHSGDWGETLIAEPAMAESYWTLVETAESGAWEDQQP